MELLKNPKVEKVWKAAAYSFVSTLVAAQIAFDTDFANLLLAASVSGVNSALVAIKQLLAPKV